MNDNVSVFKRVFIRRKWYFFVPLLIIITISITTAFVIPPKYKSKSTILIETQVVPEDLVRTTITGFVEARLQALSQRVLSVPNLTKIIQKYHLYADIKDNHTNQELVEKLTANIELLPITTKLGRKTDQIATTAFEIGFEGEDPKTVADVTNELTSIFLQANLQDREGKAKTTVDFLNSQQNAFKDEIVKKEKLIAEFKRSHPSELPELIQSNRNIMDRLAQEINLKKSELRRFADQKSFLEGQLATIDPYSNENSPDTNIETLTRRYTALKATLSENHPDMLTLKNKIAALQDASSTHENVGDMQAELNELKAQKAILEKSYSNIHPDLIALNKKITLLEETISDYSGSSPSTGQSALHPNNPIYLNMLHQIETITIDLREGKKELQALKKNYAIYARRVENTPKIEQEYKSLLRGYTTAQNQYESTTSRLMVAEQALMLEESQMAEKMTIISPPVLPERPSSPNRLAILFLGCALAFAGGIAMVAFAENMDHAIHEPLDLANLVGQPVMAVIPVITTARERMLSKIRRIAIPSGVVILIISGILSIHFLYRPLDILWMQLSRKLYIIF